MIIANQAMKQFMNSTKCKDLNKISTSFALDFIEICDCILLKENVELSKSFYCIEKIKKVYDDLTNFEASLNEIYVNDFYMKTFQEVPKLFQSIADFSFALAQELSEKLTTCYPNKSFQVILSFDIQPLSNIDDSATLRFVSKHKNEESYIDIQDIDRFDQPVMVIECRG